MSLIPIRKTFTGHIEYWDTEKKMIVIGGVDLANEIEIDTEPTKKTKTAKTTKAKSTDTK